MCDPVEVHAAHAGLRGERDELRLAVVQFAPAQAVFFLRQHDDAAAFGRLVRQRRELRGVGQFVGFDVLAAE